MSLKKNIFEALCDTDNRLSFENFLRKHVSEYLIFQYPGGKTFGRKGFEKQASSWKDLFPEVVRKNILLNVKEDVILASWTATVKQSRKSEVCLNKQEKLRIKQLLINPEKKSEIFPSKQEKLRLKQFLIDRPCPIQFDVQATFIFYKKTLFHLIICPDIKSIIDQINSSIKFNSSFFKPEKEELLDKLQNICQPALSKRGVECLSLMLSGFSVKQISLFLNISPKTVTTYLEQSYFKLKCNGKLSCLEMMHKARLLSLWHNLCNFILET